MLVGTGLVYLFNPFLGGPKEASAAWFNDNWAYRKEVPITANAAADTNAFFSFTLDTATLITAGQLQSSCQDIRVTDVSGNILAYHVGRTNACNNAATTIDALAPYAANGGVPTLPAGASTFYVYYGNPSVSSKDQGAFTQSEAASYTVGSLGSAVSGPIATLYWKFDEAQGTNAEDSTANGLDGTLSNGPAYQTENFCISAKCLYFAGTDDNVNKSDDAKLDFVAADNFTLSAWVKRNGAASANTVILQKSGANIGTTYTGYKMYMDASGDFCFDIQDGTNAVDSACTSAVEFDDDQWHLVMGVKAATTSVTLYVDGKQRAQDASIASTGTLANASTFRVGVDSDGTTNDWLGFVDEVKVFRDQTARTAAQVAADYNARSNPEGVSSQQGNNITNMPAALSNGLVGYWKVDESSGNSADSSGNGLTGTLTSATYTAGKFGNALRTNGASQNVTVTDNAVIDLNQNFTIAFWFKPAATTTTNNLLTKGSTAIYFFGSDFGGTGQIYSTVAGGGPDWLGTATSTSTSAWTHIILVSDSSGGKIYMNGVLDASTASPQTNYWNNASNLVIGGTAADKSFDDIRVYNRTLSNSEISQLYNWAPGPVGYWKMDEGSGTTAVDASGNGYNGNWNGTATWTGGKYGKAAKFVTRNSDYIQANTTLVTAYPFTMSMWFNSTYTANPQYGFILGSQSANLSQYGLYVAEGGGAGSVARLIVDATSINSTTNLADGKWHFISGVFASDTSRQLYVDGRLEANNTTSITFDSGDINRFTIGMNSSADGSKNGLSNSSLDDVKIYNYSRTQAQIIEDMNAGHPAPGSPVSSTVATWKLDEGYGTSSQDWSGNSNTLTLSTATGTWTNEGKFLKAFDGGDNKRLSRADDADLDFAAADDLSFSFWFKSDSATNPSANEYIIEKGGNIATDAIGYAIYTSAASDGLICFGIDDDATAFPEDETCSASDFYDATWHHIVAKKTGTTRLDLYVDGKPNGTADTSISATGTLANAATFYVGDTNATDGTDEFLGNLDEIKVYRSALTNEQVKLDMNRSSSEVLGALSASSDSQPNSAASEYCPPDSTAAICTGPVGEWKFDEGTGSSVNETSGNGFIGTWNGTLGSQWINGKVNKAGNYNGSNNFVSISDSTTLRPATYTLSFWIYSNVAVSTTPSDPITTPRNFRFYWGNADTNLQQACSHKDISDNDQRAKLTTTLQKNTWYHITCVYDGTNEKAYLNGKLETSVARNAPRTDVGGTIYLGNNTSLFNGKLDQVRVYNYARSQAQIAWDYNKGAPVAHWKMDECQGTTINDMSGNSNTGTLTIGATGGNTAAGTCSTSGAWFDGVAGKKNYSMDFDGTDDRISVTDSASWDFGSADFSVAWWEYRTSNSSGRTAIVRDGTDPRPPYLLGYSTGGANLLVYITSDGASWDIADAKSMGSVSLNQWVHLAITRIGSNFYTYKNGVQQDTWTSSATINSSASALRIGGPYTAAATDYYYSGQLDDVKIYNYGLTLTQLKSLYNDGATRYGPTTGAP